MQNATWRTHAARGAGAPEEKLRLVRKEGVEIGLGMDGFESFSLALHRIVSMQESDGQTVVQEQLTLTCKACAEVLYQVEPVQLEDLSAARSTGQLHLSECKPISKATAPAGQAPVIANPEQPPRTYCD